MRSVSAGALPLYGTWDICTPVIDLNISPERWIELPAPEDAKLSLPGLILPYAMSSCTVFTGSAGFTTRTLGTDAIIVTGAKSRWMS